MHYSCVGKISRNPKSSADAYKGHRLKNEKRNFPLSGVLHRARAEVVENEKKKKHWNLTK